MEDYIFRVSKTIKLSMFMQDLIVEQENPSWSEIRPNVYSKTIDRYNISIDLCFNRGDSFITAIDTVTNKEVFVKYEWVSELIEIGDREPFIEFVIYEHPKENTIEYIASPYTEIYYLLKNYMYRSIDASSLDVTTNNILYDGLDCFPNGRRLDNYVNIGLKHDKLYVLTEAERHLTFKTINIVDDKLIISTPTNLELFDFPFMQMKYLDYVVSSGILSDRYPTIWFAFTNDSTRDFFKKRIISTVS